MIVQNFRAKPGTRMAAHPEPSLDDHLWTIAAARLLLPDDVRRAGAAEPGLRRLPAAPRRRDRRLGRRLAGDGRPRQPGGALARARAAGGGDALARALDSSRASPSIPATSQAHGSTRRCSRLRCAPRTRSGSRGRIGWHPGESGGVPFVVARDALPVETTAELGEDELVRLFRARGEERQRVFAAADRLRREVCGDEVSYVVTRNIQYTNVCYFRCGFCAFSKGRLAANLRGAPVPRPARRDRAALARGLGARGDRGLPPGRDPPGVHGRLLRVGRRGDPGGAARAARPRVLGAGGLAGRGDARAAARGVPRAAAGRSGSGRCRGPRQRSSTTRCAPSSAPTR